MSGRAGTSKGVPCLASSAPGRVTAGHGRATAGRRRQILAFSWLASTEGRGATAVQDASRIWSRVAVALASGVRWLQHRFSDGRRFLSVRGCSEHTKAEGERTAFRSAFFQLRAFRRRPLPARWLHEHRYTATVPNRASCTKHFQPAIRPLGGFEIPIVAQGLAACPGTSARGKCCLFRYRRHHEQAAFLQCAAATRLA